MNRIFKIGGMFKIPDGTKLSPFLNPFDTNQVDLSPQLLSGMSIAAGEIGPGVQSEIHVHPIISLVTWVISGYLRVMMKGTQDPMPYTLDLAPEQAVLALPKTFFQLINPSTTATVRVLYITTPEYVFEGGEDHFTYDDAVTLGKDWPGLAKCGWVVPALADLAETSRRRQEARDRISNNKSRSTY